jgi:hypothetical protein
LLNYNNMNNPMPKTNKIISWFALASLAVVVVFSVNMLISFVLADTVSTSVTVGNTAPNFTTSPAEDPVSTTASPTDVGVNVVWKATANDANADNYYLLICATDSATAGTGGGVPSCDGTQYCVSGSTADDAEATCNRTALIGDSESNTWYGFACDAAASNQACNASGDQGTGDSGTPFLVNHAPLFTVANTDDSTPDPNTLVTWTTTASDGDSAGGADVITLHVCSTASFSGGTCDAVTLCTNATTPNPTCGYTSLRPDDSYGAFTYIIDNHGVVSAGVAQAEDNTFVVNNVAPTVGTINLKDTDGSGDLTLTTSQGLTTGFYAEFIVTDNNSCQNAAAGDENASAVIHARLASAAQSSCDDNGEDDTDTCIANAQADSGGSCAKDLGVDSCSGTTDTTVGWKCTFPMNYNAEPTVASSTQSATTWRVAVMATDDDSSASSLTDDSGTVEMGQFLSYAFTAGTPVAYGSVGSGADSVEQTVTMQARGNIGLDIEVSGGNGSGDGMCVSDYPTCAGLKIATAKQVHNLTAAQGWSSGTALSDSAAELEMNVNKPISSALTPTGNAYFYLQIPGGQAAGTYAGQDVFAGVAGEFAAW